MDRISPLIFDCDEGEIFCSNLMIKYDCQMLRKGRHKTQSEMSDITGLSVQCISDIENPKKNPTLYSINKYLSALGYELCIKKKGLMCQKPLKP